jgi:colicin import membrane protein
MIRTVKPQIKNGGLPMMACLSVILHLTVYFFILEFHFPTRFKESPVYYVDILNLPVSNPQAGSPSVGEVPAPPAPVPQREMTLPTKSPEKIPARQKTAKPPEQPKPAESTREFEERIARLEREAGARHAASAIEALKNKGAAKGQVGMPGATGTEAGSDYASYIKSRLEDEFRSTIAYQSKAPEAYVKLVISPSGRIIRQQIIKSSRDKVFEDSMFRAIAKAERNFRPPPSGSQFEITVKFSPQGIGKQ